MVLGGYEVIPVEPIAYPEYPDQLTTNVEVPWTTLRSQHTHLIPPRVASSLTDELSRSLNV
jgi:hypothetical protein